MNVSIHLRTKHEQIWDSGRNHPFVAGIGTGTLPMSKFRYYMRQDYLFLIDYCRVTAMAVARAETMEDMESFARSLHSTLSMEMGKHIEFCNDLGITESELKSTEPSPTTLSYTGHLLSVAANGSAGEIGAAMLPCAWGYEEIGRMLHDQGSPNKHKLYNRWIAMYASREYADQNVWLRDFVDRSASRVSETGLKRMDEAFRLSSEHEHNFWDAAYRMETSPV